MSGRVRAQGETPTGSSWINQVERRFAKTTTQANRRGSFRSFLNFGFCVNPAKSKNPIPKTLSRACSFCFGAFRCAQGMEAIIESLGQCQFLSPLRHRQFGSESFRTDEHRVIHDDSMEGVRDVFERGLNALNFEIPA
jgi:hypothetical protein